MLATNPIFDICPLIFLALLPCGGRLHLMECLFYRGSKSNKKTFPMRNLQFSGPFRAYDSLGCDLEGRSIESKGSFATDSSIQEVKMYRVPFRPPHMAFEQLFF